MYYVIFIRLFIALKLANVNSRNVAALRVLMFGGQVAETYISFGSAECHDRMQYRVSLENNLRMGVLLVIQSNSTSAVHCLEVHYLHNNLHTTQALLGCVVVRPLKQHWDEAWKVIRAM